MSLSPAAWKERQHKRQNGRCFYCATPLSLRNPGDLRRAAQAERSAAIRSATIDHVVPRSMGGTDEPINRVLACAPCNYDKAARLPTLADLVMLVDLKCAVSRARPAGIGPIARRLLALAKQADTKLGIER
ncbi:MAG: HNH endonuclease [Tagaea sp.]|nr:HNH endonuclease [Tagaea sp.]